MAASLASAFQLVTVMSDHPVALAAARDVVPAELVAALLISAIVFTVHTLPKAAEDDPDRWNW